MDIHLRCLHPPEPGTWPSLSSTVRLEIVDHVHAGDGNAVHLLGVKALVSDGAEGLENGQFLLAKIYDPLYSDYEQDDVNPFIAVDKAYPHESAAYARLEDLQGA